MTIASRLLSYIFHPLLFVTYLVLMLCMFMPTFLLIPSGSVWKFAGFVAIITFIFPAANLAMLKAFGSIPSLELRERKDRILPFLMITIFYAVVSAMFFLKVSVNVNFNKIMMLATTLVAVATVITFFFKISVHSLAMGGAIGILLPLNKVADGKLIFVTAAIFALAGLVMSARLYLQAHTQREVFYGAIAGLVVGFTGMILLF